MRRKPLLVDRLSNHSSDSHAIAPTIKILEEPILEEKDDEEQIGNPDNEECIAQ